MKRYATITALILLAFGAATTGPAAAEAEENSEPHYRCSYELQVCLDWMAKSYSNRGWAGMQLEVNDYVYKVTGVEPGSPAAKAKVRPGDLLVAVNGIEFKEENGEKLAALQSKMKPGAQFTYTLKRNGKRRNVEVVLIEMPLEVVAHQIGMHLLTDHLEADLAYSAED
jgi:predicted metalloprotease with PDZ domain